MVTHSNRTLHFFTLCMYAHKTLAVQYRSIRCGTRLLIGLFLLEIIPMKTLFIPLISSLTSIFWPQPCSILLRPCCSFIWLLFPFFQLSAVGCFIWCFYLLQRVFSMFYFLPFLSVDRKKISISMKHFIIISWNECYSTLTQRDIHWFWPRFI